MPWTNRLINGQRPVLTHRTCPDHIAWQRQANLAITKAKRSLHKKQSAQSIQQSAKATANHMRKSPQHVKRSAKKPVQRENRRREVFRFSEAKGKTVEAVELFNAIDYHAISINFEDKTCLQFSFDVGFTVKTEYTDWKTGGERSLILCWGLGKLFGNSFRKNVICFRCCRHS